MAPAESSPAARYFDALAKRDLEAFEVDLGAFTEAELEHLCSAGEKLEAQNLPPGVRPDVSVFTEPERVATSKYLVLHTYGVWRPEFAFMTEAQVLAWLGTLDNFQ